MTDVTFCPLGIMPIITSTKLSIAVLEGNNVDFDDI